MTDLYGITAVILAGGMGTRLRPVIADRPKVMADVNGRPFITYLLDQLLVDGIGEAVLCTGYLAEMVSNTLGDNYHGIRLEYSQEDVPLGTGGALRLAMTRARGELLLAMNGDSYCAMDIQELIAVHRNRQAVCSITVTEVPDVARYGSVAMTSDGAVTSFLEKGVTSGAGHINAGIYLFRPEVLEAIPFNCQVSLEREVFPGLIGAGLYGYSARGPFIDIGIPEDYRRASAFLASLQ